MIYIYIDWNRAESNPEQKQKIEGKFLLDLRSKVNDLERELTLKRAELVKVIENLELKTDQLGIMNKELERYKKEVSNLAEELSSTETNLLNEKSEKERLESELGKLQLEKSELEKKKSEMEFKIKEANEKINEMGQKISEKDQELSKEKLEKINLKMELEKELANKEFQLKSDMEGEIVKINQILIEKDKKIIDLKTSIESELSTKNDEIEAVKADLKANLYDIDRLTARNQELEHKISDSQKALDKMQMIKETMNVKGFLSDKELEEILRSA